MTDTLQAHAPSTGRPLRWWIYAVGALLGVGIVVVAAQLAVGPTKGMTITVRNETPFEVTIHTSDGPDRSVTPLGVVPRQVTETFHEVSDEGRTWYFHLDSSGVNGGTIVRTRPDLARSNWTLVIDGDAEARFRAAGLVPVPGGQ